MRRISDEVADLTSRFCDDDLTPDQAARLESLVAEFVRGPPIRKGQFSHPLRTFLGVRQGTRLPG